MIGLHGIYATDYISFTVGIVAAALVIANKASIPRRARLVGALIGLWLVAGFVILEGHNILHGCGPWSPAVVRYHDGMTVCPDQTVTISIGIIQYGR